MNAKRLALVAYIGIAGAGLWLGQNEANLLDVGVGQAVVNMLTSAASVGVSIVGGIIIYLLGGSKDELPQLPKNDGPTVDDIRI